MKSFKDDDEFLKFIEDFIHEKLASLEKDVNHCLSYPYASFPALLYCFSIIDLLASLYSGTTKGRTADNAFRYMKDMMHYTEDQCKLLQQVLRARARALKDKNGFVRDQAALSLGLIGDDRAVASLNELYGARARQESPSTVG